MYISWTSVILSNPASILPNLLPILPNSAQELSLGSKS